MRRSLRWQALVAVLLAVLPTGCHTMASLPAADLSRPNWQIRQGQATWRPHRDAVEIAGELLLAHGDEGDCFLQFTKIPLPFVVAQTAGHAWQIEFPAENRRYSGRGMPPSRIGWFQLMRASRGQSPAPGWRFESLPENRWRLDNAKTGETIEGYFAPVQPPSAP